ncbi:glycosyltransferase family 4 protein [Opitutus terrae]|uniref:Glycosyl transferase group 1 n=1 Tax=Opitutus terrae (strain DSM 11246 / JCM 15787 / PB90-1) TaxID=452637 RepID=B1ZT81_OPITP|nr:glycosyltransferase family 4 protein [Opitutus terrae]ACB76535.1 glycosyl transferase group 1 [Opitutus terrae PB90-1]
MILFSHPTGNANVRHAALGLHRAGLLGEFWTCVHYRETPLLRRVLPRSLRRQLQRRAFPAELNHKIHSAPLRELGRMLAPRAGLRSLVRHEHGPLSVDAVYRSLDQRVSQRLAAGAFSGVYAYEDGAQASFRVATERGLLRVYDLPIGYWRAARAILQEEAELQPAWAGTLTGNRDSAEKTARKDAELQQADVVLVASTFTQQSLQLAPDFRGTVARIPYGAPAVDPLLVAAREPAVPRQRLRVLFVGSLGQRKGLSYLFAAVRMLRPAVELTVIGAPPLARCAALESELAQVRWIPSCPHREVLAEMARHDVFVFPSLFEGFGLVLLEAMAMGLPIITTAHTAGPDLITDGEEGFIVPIRSAAAIAEKLDLLRRDPARRAHLSERARARAGTFSWEQYGAAVAQAVTRSPVPA